MDFLIFHIEVSPTGTRGGSDFEQRKVASLNNPDEEQEQENGRCRIDYQNTRRVEGLKNDFESERWTALSCMEMKDALEKATLLPEGHERLIAEPTEKEIAKTIGGKNDFADCIREAVKTVFANASTIVEADKGSVDVNMLHTLDEIREEIMDTGAYEQEVHGKTEYLEGINYCLSVIDRYMTKVESQRSTDKDNADEPELEGR